MIVQFIDREMELSFLQRRYQEEGPQLIIFYGRRRIGKTALINQFMKNKAGAYILCTRESIRENLKEFKEKFYRLTKKEFFLKLEETSFFDLFKLLVSEIKDQRLIIAIDEFPYLIELNKGLVATFQKIWDELISKTNLYLILCGSSIGMMETEVLGYKSPLYGRRTGEWKLQPMSITKMISAFPDKDIEEIVKLWFTLGGVPFYFLQFKNKLNLEENIKQKLLTKGEILYREPKFLLKEEFREEKTYMLILKYLSLGYQSHGKLSSATGIRKGNLSKYLATLQETGLIEHILPLGKRRGGIYSIKDPFFNFWFRFVHPNMSDLEMGLVDEVFQRIKPEFPVYYGLMFERLANRLIQENIIPLKFAANWVGRWWHRDKEIDLIALNENANQIAFFEVKWHQFKEYEEIKSILKDLKEKSSFVNWRKNKREEYFGVVARKIEPKVKERFKEEGYLIWDLADLR